MGDKQSSKKIAVSECMEFYLDEIELMNLLDELRQYRYLG